MARVEVTLPLCVECKFHETTGKLDWQNKPVRVCGLGAFDVVTGQKLTPTCGWMREKSWFCGPEGRMWVPKEDERG